MALSRVKVWVPGEVLTAADLNGEFNNILNNPVSLISPLTANLNVNGKQLTNLALENLSASPTAGTVGRIWFNTASSVKQVEVDDGTFIRAVPTILATSLNRGDFVVATTASAWTRHHMAWCLFNGAATSSGLTIIDGVGVSSSANSIIQVSSGVYVIPWETAFQSSQSYTVQVTGDVSSSGASPLKGTTLSTSNIFGIGAGTGQKSTACEIMFSHDVNGFLRPMSAHVLAIGRV